MISQIIVFQLQEQAYGIPIEKISEISHSLPVTPLIKESYGEGIVDVRGTIYSVLSMRKILEHPEKEAQESDKLIILSDKKVALLVDHVTDMMEVQPDQLQDMKSISTILEHEYLTHVVKQPDDLIALIDVDVMMPHF